MRMKKTSAILRKQWKDTLKNKTILIQFIMFPLLTIVMQNMVKIDGMPENFFVNMFSVMYVGMAPLTSMAVILSEEKETHTLRVLLMSNVKAWQYLLGTGFYVFTVCMFGTAIFAAAGGYSGAALAEFFLSMAAGILISLLTGAVIGIFAGNQMAATSVAVPVMLVFSFFPMISMFNEKVEKLSQILFTQQIRNLVEKTQVIEPYLSMLILLANFLIVLVLFAALFKKHGLA